MKPIKAVIFDCFGVLYQGSQSYLSELTPPHLRGEMHDLRVSADYGYITGQEFIEQAAQLVERDARDIEAMINSRHIRHEELFTLIISLKAKYKTAFLSNVGSHVMDKLFAPGELESLFDVTVFSSDIGTVKPNPEIYEYTAEKLGLPHEACLMIDDLEKNCLGAEAVGMKSVQYQSLQQLVKDLEALGVTSA